MESYPIKQDHGEAPGSPSPAHPSPARANTRFAPTPRLARSPTGARRSMCGHCMAASASWRRCNDGSSRSAAGWSPILGIGGIGKSSLAITVAQHIAPQFEVVLFRSLQNAPPLAGLLDLFIRAVSDQQATPPELLPDKISLLVQLLRARRCLLILDNFEAILQPGALAGTYRTGYAEYGELIQALGEREHASCLLLTSREKPAELGLLEGRTAPVRPLPLAGLDAAACQIILEAKGIAGTRRGAGRAGAAVWRQPAGAAPGGGGAARAVRRRYRRVSGHRRRVLQWRRHADGAAVRALDAAGARDYARAGDRARAGAARCPAGSRRRRYIAARAAGRARIAAPPYADRAQPRSASLHPAAGDPGVYHQPARRARLPGDLWRGGQSCCCAGRWSRRPPGTMCGTARSS